jgi:hypothetical protein
MPPFYAAPIRSVRSGWRALALAAALVLGVPAATDAHEIPKSVTVVAFVKPEGRHLRLVVRVPLEAIRDVKFPVRGPGYLLLDQLGTTLDDAAKIWIADYVQLYENDVRLSGERIVATRVSLPSDRSFETFDAAMAHVTGPRLADTTDLAWQQAMLDVAIEYPILSDSSRFSINPMLARLGVRTSTVLRFLPAHGSERAFQYIGDPGLVRLDPRWHQAALRFVDLGFGHILSGIDHLLFVFCLVIPFRRIRPLIAIITSFTVAHSITLAASALGVAPDGLWFPPLIEVLIALSIVYMALENIVGPRLDRRALIAFAFGLVHGFGFSFALRDSMQFAGTHLATSLVAFNVGVELGQLFVLALALPALALVFKHVVAERMGTIILSAFVAHTAWHWMLDRGAVLSEYRFQMPALDAALLASGMRALMLLLIVVGAGWVVLELRRRLFRQPAGSPNLTPDVEGD